MTKQKITISLESDIALKLRAASLQKYGNSRSLSLYIEDMVKAEGEKKDEKDKNLSSQCDCD